MNAVNKRKKTNSILIFNFSVFYTKLPHKLVINLNYLIDLCLMERRKNKLRLVVKVLLGKNMISRVIKYALINN